jgi:hypothetical protein
MGVHANKNRHGHKVALPAPEENDECRMTKLERSPKIETRIRQPAGRTFRHLGFELLSSFDIRHSPPGTLAFVLGSS